jgi:hypothetical protein
MICSSDFFSTFVSTILSLLWTIGLLKEPCRLSLAMDNLIDLGETFLMDNIGHDGAAL